MKPIYTETLLVQLAYQTKSIKDHAKLILLYNDLQDQGDIIITPVVKEAIKDTTIYKKWIRDSNTIEELYELVLDIQKIGQTNWFDFTNDE